MNIETASLTFTRELLKKLWIKFTKDNQADRKVCDLFTRWCEEIDRNLENAIKLLEVE